MIVPLPRDVCPLAEMADVVRYMEGQGAGQCGPCVHGLAELAGTWSGSAYGGRGGARALDRILEICNLVEGRGACRHPDGVARFVRTGLEVFATRWPRTSAEALVPDAGGAGAPRCQTRPRGEGW